MMEKNKPNYHPSPGVTRTIRMLSLNQLMSFGFLVSFLPLFSKIIPAAQCALSLYSVAAFLMAWFYSWLVENREKRMTTCCSMEEKNKSPNTTGTTAANVSGTAENVSERLGETSVSQTPTITLPRTGTVEEMGLGDRSVSQLEIAQESHSFDTKKSFLRHFTLVNRFLIAVGAQVMGDLCFMLVLSLSAITGNDSDGNKGPTDTLTVVSFIYMLGLICYGLGNAWTQNCEVELCSLLNDGGYSMGQYCLFVSFGEFPATSFSLAVFGISEFLYGNLPKTDHTRQAGEFEISSIACIVAMLMDASIGMICMYSFFKTVMRDPYIVERINLVDQTTNTISTDYLLGEEQSTERVYTKEILIDNPTPPPNGFAPNGSTEILNVADKSTRSGNTINAEEPKPLSCKDEMKVSLISHAYGLQMATSKTNPSSTNPSKTNPSSTNTVNVTTSFEPVRNITTSLEGRTLSSSAKVVPPVPSNPKRTHSNSGRQEVLSREHSICSSVYSSTASIMKPRSSWAIVKDVWQYLVGIFISFVISFTLYPSAWQLIPMSGEGNFSDNIIRMITISLWGFMGPVPRYVATKYLIPGGWYLPIVILRVLYFGSIFSIFFYFQMRVNYIVMMLLVVMFSFSNGYMMSAGYLRACNGVTNMRERALIGPWVGNCLVTGIMIGSLVSVAFTIDPK